MNIFFLDPHPARAAEMHNDKHVVKMILESAQMLSTVCRKNGHDVGYKACFENHPCTQWVGESKANFKWLCQLALELNKEYKLRFDNEDSHKSAKLISTLPVPDLPEKGLTEPPQAMPDYCKAESSVSAYRTYYREEKDHIAEWTKRDNPKFM